jgi:FtsZ-binding cell division protein ZapB
MNFYKSRILLEPDLPTANPGSAEQAGPLDAGQTPDMSMDVSADILSSIGLKSDSESTPEPKPSSGSTPNPKPAATTSGSEPKPKPSATPTDPADPGNPLDKVVEKRGRKARDLSNLDDEEKSIFNNMSLEAYNRLYPAYLAYRDNKDKLETLPNLQKELEELRAKPQHTIYDHEEGYLLSPEYRNALVERNELSQIKDFWQQQLINAHAGKESYYLVQDAKGNIDVSPTPRKASPEVIVELTERLNQSSQQVTSAAAKLSTFAESHKTKHNSYTSAVQSIHNKYFGKHEAALKPVADKFLNQYPAEFRGRPEAKLVAYAQAALHFAYSEQEQTQQVQQHQKANNKLKALVGPSSEEITAGVTTKPTKYSDAEFKELRGQFKF